MDTAALKREATIAAACDEARNKFAASHVNAAHGKLIETAIRHEPVTFGVFPTPSAFEDTGTDRKSVV